MEATQKTSTTKTALLVIAALSMLLSGLFIATASRSDASPPPACPDGFSLTADAKNCFQAAVITSADNPNSCDVGQLTPDGTKCYVAARVIPQEGSTDCPKGYSPDDSLDGMCARFETAPQNADACPEGSRGVSGSCYILVAKGPAGALTCADGSTLSGDQCITVGDDPVRAGDTCQTSDEVFEDDGECYSLQNRPNINVVCTEDGTGTTHNAGVYRLNSGLCKIGAGESLGLSGVEAIGPIPDGFTCPTVTIGATTIAGEHFPTDAGVGHSKLGICTINGSALGDCDPVSSVDGDFCRVSVNVSGGGLTCLVDGYGLVSGQCERTDDAIVSPSQCPQSSTEDSDGDCRQRVGDAAGAYYCEDANAALNGTSCVYTSGFLATVGETLYKCDTGARTVIADQVICILDDAKDNLQQGPSCLQGVLSTDNAYCIVSRIDTAPAVTVAAPVPSFTG